VSVPETWAQFSSRNVQRSAAERATSRQLRSDADTLIASCATEMWDSWNMSNNTLARRSAEVMEARSKLQMHLHKVNRDIHSILPKTTSQSIDYYIKTYSLKEYN
jgi:tektin-3